MDDPSCHCWQSFEADIQFFKTTAKVFYIHSSIALFPSSKKERKKNTHELSLSLPYESEKWQRDLLSWRNENIYRGRRKTQIDFLIYNKFLQELCAILRRVKLVLEQEMYRENIRILWSDF